jgi:xanthine/uracil/vitamin C permease (AzgA family)
MEKLFKLKAHKTNVRTEILAGLTTFMTMAYVLAVQPSAIIGGEATFVDIAGVTISREGLMLTCALVTSLLPWSWPFIPICPLPYPPVWDQTSSWALPCKAVN